MAVIGYARVSTVGQSLEAQLEKLKEAKAEKIYEETISGVRKDRPELAAMLEFARDGDTIVVTRLDRLARSTRHLLEIVEGLLDRGIRLHIMAINLDTGTPHGKLMVSMLASIAEFERALMLERQREGIAIAKEAGRYKGRKPTAQAKAAEAWCLIDQGKSKAEVARELNIGRSSLYRIIEAGRPE